MSNEGWHPHPWDGSSWGFWDGARWLTPAEAVAAGHPPPPSPWPPGAQPASPVSAPPSPWAAPGTVPGWVPPAPTSGTNGAAIAALVCGIIWVWGLGSIAAIVLGLIAFRQIDRSGGRQGGRGLATAGLVLGVVGVIGALVVTILLVSVADDYNSDPPDGFCNEDRYWQDPDCG